MPGILASFSTISLIKHTISEEIYVEHLCNVTAEHAFLIVPVNIYRCIEHKVHRGLYLHFYVSAV